MYAPEPSFPDAEHRGSGREARPYLVSSPGESHPRALAEPYVTVSRHTAPTSQLRMRENAPSASVHPSALPRAGWLRADLTCPAPFAPAPLQGLHRYYGPVRPCASRYSVSCGVCRLRVSLSRPGGNLRPIRLAVGSEATGSPIPCQRLRRAHATYTPGTTRAAGRDAPWLRDTPWACLCPGEEPKISGFDAIFWDLRCVSSGIAHARLLVAHLTRW